MQGGGWAESGGDLTKPVPGANAGRQIPDLAEISNTSVQEKIGAQGWLFRFNADRNSSKWIGKEPYYIFYYARWQALTGAF